MDEERFALEKEYYQIPEQSKQSKKHGNYRLMQPDEIPSWFI